MAGNKLILSWEEIETDCQKLSKKIRRQIDLMVAITKGGLPPATILANKFLNNPHIITLQLEEISKEGQADYKAKKVNVVSPLNTYPIKNKNVLIIDDVADSGQTLKQAIDLVKDHSPASILTAALHYKPRSHTKPDIYSRKIADDVWIVYPWE